MALPGEFAYYAGLSGLPAGTLIDHRKAYFLGQQPTGGTVEFAEYQFYKNATGLSDDFDRVRLVYWRGVAGLPNASLNEAQMVAFVAVPDVTPPNPGTVAGSNLASTSFDLTISGATDAVALHSAPYAFSSDNGGSWSAYQSSPVFNVTGKTASTGYTCKGRVRDAAGNSADTAGVLVTTTAAGVLAYQGADQSIADLATYTFTAKPIGTAGATRRVVVAAGTRTGEPTTCTIGGISATLDSISGSGNRVAYFSAVVPTGTTADIVVNLVAAGTRCAIDVWALTSGAFVTNSGSGTNGGVINQTTQVGDAVLGVSYENGTVGSLATWSGLTERSDRTVESDMSQSAADTIAVGTTTTISATWDLTSGVATNVAVYR